jgi:uncharacterized protein (TIGR03663 family)
MFTKISKKYTSLSVGWLFLAIFLLGLCIRIILPELRVLHIDEAIHAWMSYELWMNGSYLYDPKYHGPLLYYLMATAFSVFGDTDAIVRLIPGIAGAFLIPATYALYKLEYLSKNKALIAALFIAISPHLVYFSRFLRHDIFQLLFIFLCIVCIFAYLKREKWYFLQLSGIFAAFALCLKEEVPVTLFIIISFFCTMWLLGKIKLPKTWVRDGAITLLAIIAIAYTFYTSFFAHPEVFFNAADMGLTYWLGMQEECRLCGSSFWYFLMLFLYELPILALGIASAYMWFVRKNWFKQITPAVSYYLNEVRQNKKFHLIYKPLEKQELFFVFCLYWLIGSLALYGFVNEKVPWLLIHQLLPLIFVASYAYNDFKTKKAKISATASILYLFLIMIHVAFIPIADLNEPIVQVQHSEQLREMMPYIDTSSNVAIATDEYWPLPWYYRDIQKSNIKFYGSWLPPEEIYERGFDLVISHNSDSYSQLDGFTKEMYQRSYWFSWNETEDQLLEWFFLRNGEVGYDWYDVFRKTETIPR